MTKKTRSVILLSGGLDSAANLAFCRRHDLPVLALTADYGQRASAREAEAAQALCRFYDVPHRELDLRWLGALGGSALTDGGREMPSLRTDQLDAPEPTRASAKQVWVPNRNGLLINAAASYAEAWDARRIVVGFNSEEAATFPDNSQAYLEAASRALGYSTANGVEVFCYTTDWDKRRIVSELRAQLPDFPFDLLWSCYEGGATPCGRCESCRRKARAMGDA